MKIVMPLFVITAMSMPGCSLFNVKNSSKKEEKNVLRDIVDKLNSRNYQMVYSYDTIYDKSTEHPDIPSSHNSYFYLIDGNYIYFKTMDDDPIEMYVDTTMPVATTIYRKDSEGHWQTSTTDLTKEPTQIQYFDQYKHSVSDYTQVGELEFEMTPERLADLGFVSLSMYTTSEDVYDVHVDSLVNMEKMLGEYHVTGQQRLSAVLSRFGSINIELPTVTY